MKYDAVIFALNGVFIQSPKLSARFSADFGVPTSDFLSGLDAIMDVVRKPNAPSLYSQFKPYFDKWNVHMTEPELHNYWFSAETLNREMLDVAAKCKHAGIRLFALSNNFRERAAYYAKQFPELASTFEAIHYSWQTGFVKPDAQAWSHIAQKHGLNPAQTLYFDDSSKNVPVALAEGFDGNKFEGAQQVLTLVFGKK